jgi:hypothetical protein
MHEVGRCKDEISARWRCMDGAVFGAKINA